MCGWVWDGGGMAGTPLLFVHLRSPYLGLALQVVLDQLVHLGVVCEALRLPLHRALDVPLGKVLMAGGQQVAECVSVPL